MIGCRRLLDARNKSGHDALFGENQSGNGPRTRDDSSAWSWCQTVYKPGSVSPVWRTVGARMAIHLGRPSPGASRDRPERRRERPARRSRQKPRPPAAPTWSCSRWGLPCRRRCRRRGALLPHHFTLAARRPERRTSSAVCFCGTFPGVAPAGRYPAPCLRGARTFLPAPSEPGVERPSDRLAGKIWDGAPRLSNRATGPARVRYYAERVAKPRVALNRDKSWRRL